MNGFLRALDMRENDGHACHRRTGTETRVMMTFVIAITVTMMATMKIFFFFLLPCKVYMFGPVLKKKNCSGNEISTQSCLTTPSCPPSDVFVALLVK